MDTVQVLVEAVQQEGHELLGVVLSVARELAGLAGHDGLEGEREREGETSDTDTQKDRAWDERESMGNERERALDRA